MSRETVNYSFAYYTKGREDIADEFAIDDNMMRNVTYDSTITWDVIVRDFLSFLSGVYGYDIGNQVEFESFSERIKRVREENDFSAEWPWADEENKNAEGEEAPKV